jgi:sodium-dependent dicarboxylate transporter 2/3/5
VNIITVSLLQEKASIYLSFLEWMKHTYSFTLWSLFILCGSVFYSIKNLKGPFQLQKYEKKPVSSEEIIFYFLFFCIILLWLLPSFSQYLPFQHFIEKVLTPSFVIFFMSLLLFFIPSKRFGVLLSWKDTKSIDYSSLFLFSAGLGLGYLIQKTQLAAFIGTTLFASVVDSPSKFTILAVVFTLILTEFVSNAVCISLILPIVLGFCLNSSIDPLKISILLAITSSLCFLFPMGTPPNSLVYSTGHISKKQFFIFGFYFKAMMAILMSIYVLF